MSAYKHLRIEDKDHIRTITLSNPKQLNALHNALLDELSVAVDALYEEKQLVGAILIGDGPHAFAAGADITAFTQLTADQALQLSQRGQRLFQRIEDCPIVVVAAVRGFALGGGCELAMACHLRVASPSARFGQPELKLGLIPGYGGTQRLVQLIGKTKAMEWILTAETYQAEKALHVGLLNHVVAREEELEPYVRQLIGKIAANSPEAVAAAIDCVNQAAAPQGYGHEAQAFGRCAATDNAREGIAAFLQKRKAAFAGR